MNVAATVAENPPSGSPRCWSLQYQDNERECMTCPFKVSCKGAYQRAMGQQPPQGYQPQYQYPTVPFPQQPVYQIRQQPPQPGWVPPPPPAMQVVPPRPPVPYQAQQPQQVQYMPPGNNFLGVQEGETVGERLGKNVVLRTAEAIFTELARFFHYFTWPKTKE